MLIRWDFVGGVNKVDNGNKVYFIKEAIKKADLLWSASFTISKNGATYFG